jgi:hypothetical protein
MKLILPLGLIGLAVANPLPKPESEGSDLISLVGNFEEVQYNNEDCYEDNVDMKAGNDEGDLFIDNFTEESDPDCEDEPIEEVDFLDVNVDDVEPGQTDPDEYLAKMSEEEYYDEECEEDPIDPEDPNNELPDNITTPEPRMETQPGNIDGDDIYDNSDCYDEEIDSDDADQALEDYDNLGAFDGESLLKNAEAAYSEIDDMLSKSEEIFGAGEGETFEECIEY